jgi:hypothetical protein
MTILSEGSHAAAFLVSEAAGTRSRERITVLSGESLVAGAVLGKVTLGAATPAPFSGNAANTGTIATVSLGAGAKAGIYRLVVVEPASNAGAFTLEDPDGVTIGTGTVGVEFTGGGLTFTLADGATDFKAGEGFTLTVAAGSGKYRLYHPASTDGSQVALAVLFSAVDATAADRPGVAVVRDAEVAAAELSWFAGASGEQKATGLAQLAGAGIIAR